MYRSPDQNYVLKIYHMCFLSLHTAPVCLCLYKLLVIQIFTVNDTANDYLNATYGILKAIFGILNDNFWHLNTNFEAF